ncbi:MAG: hypothetical protein EOP40_16985 [Rubrivivax sp.]|nr:MAG: hypothetical protein EOP40_16985 [Rubrivivax sp.]
MLDGGHGLGGAHAADDHALQLHDFGGLGGDRDGHPGGAGQRDQRDEDGGADGLQAGAGGGGGADAVHGAFPWCMAASVFVR